MSRKPDATAGIIVIGDEILSGKVSDENASHLVRELRELGVTLRRITVIPDVVEDIAQTVSDFSASFDHVFTSGGVGPTHDDLTIEGVARAFGQSVVRHPELERLLRGYFGERLVERNLRLADVPQGATLTVSDQSPWPVVTMGNVYILPGVPEIFRHKFAHIREQFRQRPFHLRCIYCATDEGHIAAHLDDIATRFADVALGSYPRFRPAADGWQVKLTLEAKDAQRVDAACAELTQLLGAVVVKVE